MNKENVVAIIIARGGSKSIPRKNVLPLKGKPLIAWSIELAKSVSQIDRVIMSTDDDEIASIAQTYGAEVLFKRPAELAQDDTPSLAVVRHCVEYLQNTENYKADIVLLFFPTSPFLKKERVEEALKLFNETKCNSVLSVVKDWGRFWKIENGQPTMLYPLNRVNRQFYEPLCRENGAIYFNRYDVIMGMNKIIDEHNVQFLIMDEKENIDIDYQADWVRAEKFDLK